MNISKTASGHSSSPDTSSEGVVVLAATIPVLTQAHQDNIWRHFQNHGQESFDLSYARLRYLAERCHAGVRVLNIGVGSGGLEKLLIERGVEVCSLDPSEETILRLQAELGMGERAKQGYSQAVPFGDGSFDKVIMTEVLEHLPGDTLRATLGEVLRVLRPGGKFIGTVPYRENLQSNEAICPYCGGQFHRWGHQQCFDLNSLEDLLESHGFIVEKLYSRSFPDFRRPGLKLFIKAAFRYVLGRMGEPLVGPNLYFIARK